MMARDQVSLVVRQEPERAQVVPDSGNKNRKPIDPPPIVELKYDARNDPYNKEWLVSPRLFMMGQLVAEDGEEVPYLSGQTTSSLHKLKEQHADKDGGFFIFGDMSVKKTGKYRLRFHLFDMSTSTRDGEEGGSCELLATIESAIFDVKNSREFGSMAESTTLTKTFSDQGVKLRVRKQDPRSAAGQKRSFGSPEISPSRNTAIYSGAVQDHYSNSPMHANKRQRSTSDYDGSHYYQDTPLATYASTDRSGRYSMSSTHSLGTSSMGYHPTHSRGQSYSQQPSMNYSLGRPQSYMSGLPPAWGSIPQQSALSSHPSYATSTQSHYQQQAQPDPNSSIYQPQALPDTHQSFQDLPLPASLATGRPTQATSDHAYSSTYPNVTNLFADTAGSQGSYSYPPPGPDDHSF